jgi:hypothetical protein
VLRQREPLEVILRRVIREELQKSHWGNRATMLEMLCLSPAVALMNLVDRLLRLFTRPNPSMGV